MNPAKNRKLLWLSGIILAGVVLTLLELNARQRRRNNPEGSRHGAAAAEQPPPAPAPPVDAAVKDPFSDADRLAIRELIVLQLACFVCDNAEGAFSFAAPGIQQNFGTPERFLEMVRRSYAPVYRPLSVEFGDLFMHPSGQPVQNVELVGPTGGRSTAHYQLHKQPDGSWRISGCNLRRATW